MTPDIIGTIYEPTGNMLTDSDGFEYPETEAIPGFHVNFPTDVPEIADYKLDPQPTTPHRVYAGGVTPVMYTFPDEATFRSFIPEDEDSEAYQNWNQTMAERQALHQKRKNATLTRADFKLALLGMGELANVKAAMNATGTPERAKILWEDALQFDRLNEDFLAMAASVGYTDAQMDQLFGIE